MLWFLGAILVAACRPGADYSVRFVDPKNERHALEVLETYLRNDGCLRIASEGSRRVVARFDCLDERNYEVFLAQDSGSIFLSFVSVPYGEFEPPVTCQIEQALRDLSIQYESAYEVVSRVGVPPCDENDGGAGG
jgi:hypothetical protein